MMRSRRAGRKRKARHASSTLVVQTSYDSFPMAANGSSANMANIITALGNAFKDPSGATMSNDRLAAVLLQNMSQLTDLAKQGKLNQQQIMQVRRTLLTCEFPAHHQRMFTFPGVPSCGITQTSTSPPRQSRYLRGTPISVPIHLTCLAVASGQYSPPGKYIGSQGDDGKLTRPNARRKLQLEGHVPDQSDAECDESGSRLVADCSSGTPNTHGWYDGGPHSRCVFPLRNVFGERGG